MANYTVHYAGMTVTYDAPKGQRSIHPALTIPGVGTYQDVIEHGSGDGYTHKYFRIPNHYLTSMAQKVVALKGKEIQAGKTDTTSDSSDANAAIAWLYGHVAGPFPDVDASKPGKDQKLSDRGKGFLAGDLASEFVQALNPQASAENLGETIQSNVPVVGDTISAVTSVASFLGDLASAIFTMSFWIRVLEGLIALSMIGIGLAKLASDTPVGRAAEQLTPATRLLASRQAKR